MVDVGLSALSVAILNTMSQVGLHVLATLDRITQVNLLFVGVNCCAWYCAVFKKLTFAVLVN